MPAGIRTFGLDETLIEPQVLPPPPTRHALLAFLLALAAILQIGTVGWGDIQNGAEGHHASAARAMLRADTWSAPGPPLGRWLTIASYKIFGVNAIGARLPAAVAMVGCVAFTFLIGERLGGYWRGFSAGLIHLCSLGSFVWPRLATPEPIFAAFIGGTIFCAVRGFQRQRNRRFWFAGVWICAALACLTKGLIALLYPAAVFLLLALFFREARLRFRALFFWPNLLLLLALVLPWFAWTEARNLDGVGLGPFLGFQFASAFPTIFLILPGVTLAWRKVFRPHEFDFAAALPLCWIAIGFLPLPFISQRQNFDSISLWSGSALFAATAWERTSSSLRLAGFALVAAAGIAVICAAALDFTAMLPPLPSAWLSTRAVVGLIGAAILFFAGAGAYFSWRDRETLAIAILLLGMVPIGLCIAEGMARFGSYLSLAEAARFLEPKLSKAGEVLFEGSESSGSSLEFYLDKPPLIVSPFASQDAVTEKLRAPHPVYLIIGKERVPYWQERLTTEFHIFHQEAACGGHVVLSNRP